jgi:hypothetical protein
LTLFAWSSGSARADEKKDYPASLLERPMTLPPLMFQPTFEFNLTNINGTAFTPSQQGESIGFGLDLGVAKRLQLGAFFAFPLNPVADFGGFVFDLQANLNRAVNFRFDLGTERISFGSNFHSDTFVFGLGLPIKAKLGRYVAFISGNTQARGFGKPVLLAFGKGGIWGGAVSQTNDVIAVQAAPSSGGTAVGVSVHLPIGLLIQPHRAVSFAVRTGYRFNYSTATGGSGTSSSVTTHSVPLAFELTFTLFRIFDLGFVATLYGFVAGTSATGGLGSGAIQLGYADVQRYDFWFAGRF